MNRLSLTAAVIKPLVEGGVLKVEVVERSPEPLLEMQRLARKAPGRGDAGPAKALPGTQAAPPSLNPGPSRKSQIPSSANMMRVYVRLI